MTALPVHRLIGVTLISAALLLTAAPTTAAEQSAVLSGVEPAAAAAITQAADCRRAKASLRRARAENARPHHSLGAAVAAQFGLERARRQKAWLCVPPATTCPDAQAVKAAAADNLGEAQIALHNTGTSWNRSDLRAATRAYTRAAANSQALCHAEAVTNYSGQVGDPRPADWIRPADGSSQPGSNDPRVTITPGCPLTASRVWFTKGLHNVTDAAGHTTQEHNLFVGMAMQNYSATDVTVTVDEWILDQDGKPLELVKPDPDGHLRPRGAFTVLAWGDSGHGNAFMWWNDNWDLTRFTYRAVVTCQAA